MNQAAREGNVEEDLRSGGEPGIEYSGVMYETRTSKPYQVLVTYIIVIYISQILTKKNCTSIILNLTL